MAKSNKPIAKKKPASKPAPAKKPDVKAKVAPAKPAPAKVAPAKPVAKAPAAPAKPASKAPMSAADLKRKILERKTTGTTKAIAFSLDEVREIAKKNEKQIETSAKTGKTAGAAKTAKAHDLTALEKPHKPHHVKTASLADILGFNPSKGKKAPAAMIDESEVPEKFRRYYRLLLDLRHHVLTQLGEHTEETLMKSSKDDSGDLSGYGQHMADAGTDTFDRDFALSLVSGEQEALAEIEAAIKRIHAGTYGICEATQKPIAKERLLAVPFTRYSAEAKKQPKPAKSKVAKPELKKKPSAPIKAKAVKTAPPAKPTTPAKPSPTMEKPSKKNALRDSILKRKAPAKPIAFSLDEVRAIAKTVPTKPAAGETITAKAGSAAKAKLALAAEKPAKPNHIKAASLSDILGFNPKQSRPDPSDAKDIPEKFKRYYKLLLDLRSHLTAGIELHSEETLKRSSKDDSGDLSSYGQHMADAGTDTFDRDFALSLVSSEQEALTEIDAAIKRIHTGAYGICEITQKPIAKERLLAVPFTRYSAEAQKDIEKNRMRSRTQAGLFGELGEEGGTISSSGGDDGGDE